MPNEEPDRLSDEQINEATAKRESFFRFFDDNGIQYAQGNVSKPYTGTLSRGCQSCVNGAWSCIYFNTLCTKNCFYCPQDRAQTEEAPPKTDDHLIMKSANDYIEYLNMFPFEGIGFSGGEPLLQIDKLIEYIKAIRSAFGSKHYIWVYSNGDLVTEETAIRLNEAGINELRLNISTNEYHLEPVTLAAKHIDTVTIEIPAIPEDMETVKSKLKDFEAAGVKHLNLHQLLINKHNQDEFIKRNYSITNPEFYKEGRPVLESEMTALEIIKHALSIDVRMGINYCSRSYKARFQEPASRKRHAAIYKDENDFLTKTGYLRKFTIGTADSPQTLSRNQADDILTNPHNEKLNVIYDKLKIERLRKEDTKTKRKASIANNDILINREEVLNYELSNNSSKYFFKKLFIEEKIIPDVADDAINAFGMSANDKKDLIKDISEFYKQFETVEYTQEGLHPYN